MKTLIVIIGPTGVGKSALCIDVAKHFGVPIINCDSRQMYRELPIGTAAPTKEDMREVKHYFVGNLSIHDYYSASRYEQEVMEIINGFKETIETPEISVSGNTPLLVEGAGEVADNSVFLLSGGSMMYEGAVCNGIDDIPTVDAETRQLLLGRYAAEGLEPLVRELRLLDPAYYAIVDQRNPKRVLHALEICYMTGRTYTSFRTRSTSRRPFDILKIGLTRPREELYERINERVDQMMADGLLNEAQAVYERYVLPARQEGKPVPNALNTVGYKELFAHFDGEWTLDFAIDKIKQNTRIYSRKQMTWFKRDDTIHWFHPDDRQSLLQLLDEPTPSLIDS